MLLYCLPLTIMEYPNNIINLRQEGKIIEKGDLRERCYPFEKKLHLRVGI